MGSSTRTILPIALFFGVIFGITFLSNNTNAPVTKTTKTATPPTKRPDPLAFGIVTAEPNEQSPHLALRTMKVDWEVKEEGHFDFWFQNLNSEEVQLYLQGKSCTCAGAKFAVVSADATRRFLQISAISTVGNPLQSLAALPFASMELVKDLKWDTMSVENENDRKTVPPAKDDPSLGILRVTFSNSKPNNQQRINARVMTVFSNGSAAVPKDLSVVSRVGTSIKLFPRYNGDLEQLDYGLIRPLESEARDVYIFSLTREDFSPRIDWSEKDAAHPCITFTPPVIVKGDEFEETRAAIASRTGVLLPIRSIYKTTVTVRERIEEGDAKKVIRRMELGPFEKFLRFTIDDGSEFNSARLPIRGTIRGELRVVLNTDERDRIDFGKTVNTVTGETREAELISERPGLDVELLPDETSPPYLQVEMTLKGEQAGKKVWILKVRIPPGRLNGSLPANSGIVVQMKDGSNHRMRIPIVGQGVQSGRQL